MEPLNQPGLLQALGWAVLNSFWQMALLWLMYELLSVSIGRSEKRSSLASIFLFTGFGWFLFTFFNSLDQSTGSLLQFTSLSFLNENDQLNSFLPIILTTASILYLVLLIIPFYYYIRSWRFANAIRYQGLIKADAHWRIFVQKTAEQMGVKQKVKIWFSEFIHSPVTVGYLKPVILFPVAAINQLTTQQTEAILLHELAHIKRADFLINLLIKGIQALLYFNPFVKLFVSAIEREREKSCDEMVLQFQYEPHSYASALLAVEKLQLRPQLALAAAGTKKSELLLRIETILGIAKKTSASSKRIAAAFILFIIFFMAAFFFPNGKNIVKATWLPFQNTDYSYAFLLTSPVEENITTPVEATCPVTAKTTIAITKKRPVAPAADLVLENTEPSELATNPDIVFVNQTETVIPQLEIAEEKQVVEAMESSKKILQEQQWKKMETSFADAVTRPEKEKIRTVFEKSMKNLNWNKMADRLRTGYDQIDWKRVNSGLDQALVHIELDSLHTVFTTTLTNLDDLKVLLIENNQTCIPDTDITLCSIDEKKVVVQKYLDQVKSIRNKRVLHF